MKFPKYHPYLFLLLSIQGNELHSRGQYTDAAAKYKLVRFKSHSFFKIDMVASLPV
jgi:hypothetical protein